jgi:hypothetical protein
VGVFGVESNKTVKAPERKKEAEVFVKKMERLYGTDAGHLMALEDNLQSHFMSHYQQFQPDLWPNIPFRL